MSKILTIPESSPLANRTPDGAQLKEVKVPPFSISANFEASFVTGFQLYNMLSNPNNLYLFNFLILN